MNMGELTLRDQLYIGTVGNYNILNSLKQAESVQVRTKTSSFQYWWRLATQKGKSHLPTQNRPRRDTQVTIVGRVEAIHIECANHRPFEVSLLHVLLLNVMFSPCSVSPVSFGVTWPGPPAQSVISGKSMLPIQYFLKPLRCNT